MSLKSFLKPTKAKLIILTVFVTAFILNRGAYRVFIEPLDKVLNPFVILLSNIWLFFQPTTQVPFYIGVIGLVLAVFYWYLASCLIMFLYNYNKKKGFCMGLKKKTNQAIIAIVPSFFPIIVLSF